MDEYIRTEQVKTVHFFQSDRSDWQVEMFGCGPFGIVFTPAKDHVPNWFWRQMQYLVLGNKWTHKGEKHEVTNNPHHQRTTPVSDAVARSDADSDKPARK